MSQFMTMVEAAKNGSMHAEVGSGMRVMSDSLIALQPAIEEPSKPRPSANASSSMSVWSKVTCCHLPRGSVKRRSTYLTSLSLIALRTSLAVFIVCLSSRLSFARLSLDCPPVAGAAGNPLNNWLTPLDRVCARLPGADADGFLDMRYKYLAIADAPGLGGVADRLDRGGKDLVSDDDLDLHLRQKVDDVFRPAIEFRMALLPAKPLGLDNRDSLNSRLLQGFLHFIELEWLDDRLDLFHCGETPVPRLDGPD